MPRGQTSEVGEERVQQNGYVTVRTETGWRFKHHVLAEELILRRPLQANEMVKFRDGDKTNLHPDNLLVALRGSSNARKRLAVVQERIRELKAEEVQLLDIIRGVATDSSKTQA